MLLMRIIVVFLFIKNSYKLKDDSTSVNIIWWDNIVSAYLSKSNPDVFFLCTIGTERVDEKKINKSQEKHVKRRTISFGQPIEEKTIAKITYKVKEYFFQMSSSNAASQWVEGIFGRLKKQGQIDGMDSLIIISKKEIRIKRNMDTMLNSANISRQYIIYNTNTDLETSLREFDLDSVQGIIAVGSNSTFLLVFDILTELNYGDEKYFDFVPESDRVKLTFVSIPNNDHVFLVSNFIKGLLRNFKEVTKFVAKNRDK